MADYGIKVSKAGQSVTDVPSESNKKNFVVLDASESQKLVYAEMIKNTTYTHNLGYVPIYYVFGADDGDNPTVFTRDIASVECTTTVISGFANPSYIMLFYRS